MLFPEIGTRGIKERVQGSCFCCGWLFFTDQNYLDFCLWFASVCFLGLTNISITDIGITNMGITDFYRIVFFLHHFFEGGDLASAKCLIKVHLNRAIPLELGLVFTYWLRNTLASELHQVPAGHSILTTLLSLPSQQIPFQDTDEHHFFPPTASKEPNGTGDFSGKVVE